ncbi:MAG: alpha/beta hydrolase [Bacteroidetes bacterium]|nr:alpha/beta hydrolase [Bacteroidota bacterium]
MKITALIAGLLIVVGILILFFMPSHIKAKEEVKREMTLSNSHFLTWRGAEIHYTDEGNGMPLLMIHGLGGSHRNFQKLAAEMKDQYRVIRVDLPGFGMSDFPAGEITDLPGVYRDFFVFFLDTLHIDSIHLMGNSMGGMMAWNIAAAQPEKVKTLTLLASAGYELDKIAKVAARFTRFKFLEPILEKGIPMAVSEANADRIYADKTKVDLKEVYNNNVFWNREGNVQALMRLTSSGQYPDSSLIKTVQCPTLVIWGKEDEIVPYYHAEKFIRDIPNSKLVTYSPCGHVPMIEKTEEVKRDFEAFVKEVELEAKAKTTALSN